VVNFEMNMFFQKSKFVQVLLKKTNNTRLSRHLISQCAI